MHCDITSSGLWLQLYAYTPLNFLLRRDADEGAFARASIKSSAYCLRNRVLASSVLGKTSDFQRSAGSRKGAHGHMMHCCLGFPVSSVQSKCTRLRRYQAAHCRRHFLFLFFPSALTALIRFSIPPCYPRVTLDRAPLQKPSPSMQGRMGNIASWNAAGNRGKEQNRSHTPSTKQPTNLTCNILNHSWKDHF